MPSIGHVQRQNDGSFRGALKTLSVNAEIAIIPNRSKTGDQPDYRVLSNGVELGGGWVRTGEGSQPRRLSRIGPAPVTRRGAFLMP